MTTSEFDSGVRITRSVYRPLFSTGFLLDLIGSADEYTAQVKADGVTLPNAPLDKATLAGEDPKEKYQTVLTDHGTLDALVDGRNR